MRSNADSGTATDLRRSSQRLRGLHSPPLREVCAIARHLSESGARSRLKAACDRLRGTGPDLQSRSDRGGRTGIGVPQLTETARTPTVQRFGELTWTLSPGFNVVFFNWSFRT